MHETIMIRKGANMRLQVFRLDNTARAVSKTKLQNCDKGFSYDLP